MTLAVACPLQLHYGLHSLSVSRGEKGVVLYVLQWHTHTYTQAVMQMVCDTRSLADTRKICIDL